MFDTNKVIVIADVTKQPYLSVARFSSGQTGRKAFTSIPPREAFASLIDKVSGKGTWDSNPWVFVSEFELVK